MEKLPYPIKRCTFQLPVDIDQKLQKLADLSGTTRTEWVVMAVQAQWDTLEGNPMAKQVLEQLNALSDLLKGPKS